MSSHLRTEAAMQEIRVHLAAGQGAEAVRAFLDALDSGVVPRDLGRASALVKAFGKADAQKLLEAFAVWACPYCRGGVEKCEACAGRGSTSGDEEVCETCASLGVSGCDFCAGSGWVSYNAIPEPLRVHVAAVRVHRAVKSIKSLAAQSAAAAAGESFTRTAQRLLSINRLAGALENALVLTSPATTGQVDPTAARVRHACRAAGREVLRLALAAIDGLARISRAKAAREPAGSPGQMLAAHRAAYFLSLASPAGLARCRSLDHPFLWSTTTPPAVEPPEPPADAPAPSQALADR